MNRKTLSRFVILCLVVVMLASAAISTGLVVAGAPASGASFNFTAFRPVQGVAIPAPAVLACDGCSGGGNGPG